MLNNSCLTAVMGTATCYSTLCLLPPGFLCPESGWWRVQGAWWAALAVGWRSRWGEWLYHHPCMWAGIEWLYHHVTISVCGQVQNDCITMWPSLYVGRYRMIVSPCDHHCMWAGLEWLYHHCCTWAGIKWLYHHCCMWADTEWLYHHHCMWAGIEWLYHHHCTWADVECITSLDVGRYRMIVSPLLYMGGYVTLLHRLTEGRWE